MNNVALPHVWQSFHRSNLTSMILPASSLRNLIHDFSFPPNDKGSMDFYGQKCTSDRQTPASKSEHFTGPFNR
ncbi:hypothetical protein HPP92_007096 [Vanilla planifolia]|uniref:Uncharacterized protein n=1 Tax=Vanilla planifolia TaxID=51239 RepID=A0A835R9U6_VANPL|nr:hypothetical protein HPP92_007096 [Vanilla planifolia]